MKNSAALIVLCFLFCTLISRGRDESFIKQHLSSVAKNPNSQQNNISISTTPFFSEDFSGGLPSGWMAVDSSGNGVNWHYTTSGTYNSFYDSLSVSGTSAANGYMIYDSDSAGHSVGGENASLISPRINCSTHATVHLTLNEYLTYYNDTAVILVSTDGISWTEVHNSSSGLSQYQSTANPNFLDIDISSIAANEDSVYICFNYRADFSFFWMIDDVQLYESPNIDGSVTNIVAPSAGCTLLSSNKQVTITVTNTGGDSITGGFDVTYIVDGGTPVTEQAADTIPPGSSIDYTFAATTDFSVPGNHTVVASIDLTGDTLSSNDSFTLAFFNGPHVVNTNTVYGNGFEPSDDLTGYFTEDNNGDSATWHVSTLFPYAGNYCAQLSSATADDWYFTTCLDLDSTIVYNLKYYYRTTSTSTRARYHVMTGQAQSSNNVIQEIVPETVLDNIFYQQASAQFTVANSGTYYIGFHVQSLPGDSLVGMLLDNLFIGPDSGVGISSLNNFTDVTVFPNPSTGKIILNTREHASGELTVEIINSVGTLIYSEKVPALNNFEIDLDESSPGLYFVRIISGDLTSVKKIVVR